MAWYPYQRMLAYDMEGRLVPGGSGSLYADDTSVEPLPVRVDGQIMSTLTANRDGMLPGFELEDRVTAVWRSGGYKTDVHTIAGVDVKAQSALDQISGLKLTIETSSPVLPSGGEPGQVLYRGPQEGQGVWAPPPSGAGGTGVSSWTQLADKPSEFPAAPHSHTSGQLADSTSLGRTLLTASSAEQVRQAIGAGTGSGTSNLTLGQTATTAAPGNHVHVGSSVSVVPSGSVTATNVQDAITQLAQSSQGGGGTGEVKVWRYTNGAWPALPVTQPVGVMLVDAQGPTYPTNIPGWIGKAAGKVPLRYVQDTLS